MHLYDMQFICFVGHNFSDREAKIGMLCLEGNLVRLCWLVCRQPYKKRKMEELDHLMIHKVTNQARLLEDTHIESCHRHVGYKLLSWYD